MAKLFKWLMVLFIPLFSLTLTSCGGDDEDEPENLSANFLVGEWSGYYYSSANKATYITTLTFDKNGKYVWRETSETDYNEERGIYTYQNGKLITEGYYYHQGIFSFKTKNTYEAIYDDFTSKLIFLNVNPGDHGTLVGWDEAHQSNQYSRK